MKDFQAEITVRQQGAQLKSYEVLYRNPTIEPVSV